MHASGQVQINLQRVLGIRGGHEPLGLHRQQVVLAHDACYPLAVHNHPAASQLRGHPPVPVAPPVLQRNPLDRRPHFHALLHRHLLLRPPPPPLPLTRTAVPPHPPSCSP